jgi:hypothetical protein
MTLTDAQRYTVTVFTGAIDRIATGPDRYPIPHPDRVADLGVLGQYLLKIDMMFLGRDDLNPEQRSLLVLADATAAWIAEFESGNRDPEIAERWFRARAELGQITS